MPAYSGADPERPEGGLPSYVRAIRAHAAIVAVLLVMTVGCAAAWLAVKEPSYTATAELLITPLPANDPAFLSLQLLRDSNDPTRTAQTAAALIDSPRAAKLAARSLGAGFSQDRVENAVEVQPQGQSNIIAVSARAKDPPTAARVANAFAQSALQVRRELLREQVAQLLERLRSDPAMRSRIADLRSLGDDDPTMSLSQPAAPPSDADGVPAWLILALAAIAGLAIASGVALLMDLGARRLRDAQEAQDTYPLPVLARIPRLSRAARGRGPIGLPPAVREAYRTLRTQIDGEDGHLPRVVMITSASAGDGKTSCAINLSLALVAAGRRVVLLDFDLRKPDVGRLLAVEDGPGLVSLLRPDTTLEEVLVSTPYLPRLRVAAAATGDGDIGLLPALSRRAPGILEEARALADFVILDTAPLGEVSDALRLSAHVDDVLVVVRPAHTRRESFEFTRELLDRAGRLPTGLVLFATRSTSSSYAYGSHAQDPERRRPLARLAGR